MGLSEQVLYKNKTLNRLSSQHGNEPGIKSTKKQIQKKNSWELRLEQTHTRTIKMHKYTL
jgi:hypothetical protein